MNGFLKLCETAGKYAVSNLKEHESHFTWKKQSSSSMSTRMSNKSEKDNCDNLNSTLYFLNIRIFKGELWYSPTGRSPLQQFFLPN